MIWLSIGVDKTVQVLFEELEKQSRPMKGRNDIQAVASISAGNDDVRGTRLLLQLVKLVLMVSCLSNPPLPLK